MSVEEYERETGNKAKDWLVERHRTLGIDGPGQDDGKTRAGGYRD